MRCAESLNDWKRRMEALTERLKRAIEGLEEAELNRPPDPKTWSPAQVAEHLVLSNRPYLNAIESALERASPSAEEAETRFSFCGNLICKAAGPGGNAPAPPALVPSRSAISKEIFAEWVGQQERFLALADRAAGVNLSGVKVRNPLIKLIPMNLADLFAIMTAHTERHIAQIEERVPKPAPVASA